MDRIQMIEATMKNAIISLRICKMPQLDSNVASNVEIIDTVIKSLEQALELVNRRGGNESM